MIRAILVAAILAGAHAPVFAQSVPVPLTETERALVMELCGEAQWAARRRFDGMCDYLRGKFDAAVRAAAEKVEAEKPKPQDQPKENE